MLAGYNSCCNSTSGNCSGGLPSNSSGAMSADCFCDANCRIYGDCCSDVSLDCATSSQYSQSITCLLVWLSSTAWCCLLYMQTFLSAKLYCDVYVIMYTDLDPYLLITDDSHIHALSLDGSRVGNVIMQQSAWIVDFHYE